MASSSSASSTPTPFIFSSLPGIFPSSSSTPTPFIFSSLPGSFPSSSSTPTPFIFSSPPGSFPSFSFTTQPSSSSSYLTPVLVELGGYGDVPVYEEEFFLFPTATAHYVKEWARLVMVLSHDIDLDLTFKGNPYLVVLDTDVIMEKFPDHCTSMKVAPKMTWWLNPTFAAEVTSAPTGNTLPPLPAVVTSAPVQMPTFSVLAMVTFAPAAGSTLRPQNPTEVGQTTSAPASTPSIERYIL